MELMYVKAPLFHVCVGDVWHIHSMKSNCMNINIYHLVLIVVWDLFQMLYSNSFNPYNYLL